VSIRPSLRDYFAWSAAGVIQHRRSRRQKEERQTMAQSYVRNLVHGVFSTKRRVPMINDELRARLYPFIGGIARKHEMHALAVGGTVDHVHVLLDMPGTMSISKAMQLVKGASSKWVKEVFP